MHLREKRCLDINQIFQWLDDCSSQYKSKGPFADLAASEHDFGLQIHGAYFWSRHGKGPCDGEAVVVKNHVAQAVKQRTIVIGTAAEQQLLALL